MTLVPRSNRHRLHVQSIMTDHVDVPSRLRAVDASKVEQIAQSMDAIGLQTPITVHHAHRDAEGFDLIAGAHRLAAAKSLGWEWIDAIFTDADEIDRQLWEIDENLMRSELTPTQMAEHLAKRKELWEVRSSGAIRPTGGGAPGKNKNFAQSTSEITGMDKRNINKAIARARDVAPDVLDEVRGTDMDKGVVLDDIARTPPERQRERLQELRDNRRSKIDADVKARAVREGAEEPRPAKCRPAPKVPPELSRAWREAGQAEKAAFVQMIRREGWT